MKLKHIVPIGVAILFAALLILVIHNALQPEGPKHRIVTDGVNYRVEEKFYGEWRNFKNLEFKTYAEARKEMNAMLENDIRNEVEKQMREKQKPNWKVVETPPNPVPCPSPTPTLSNWTTGGTGQVVSMSRPTPGGPATWTIYGRNGSSIRVIEDPAATPTPTPGSVGTWQSGAVKITPRIYPATPTPTP